MSQNITTAKDGKFKATVDTDEGKKSETFDTFSEAERFVEQHSQEGEDDTPEIAASEMDPEYAEKINSNVHVAGLAGDNVDQDEVDAANQGNDDPGSGNRQAPHPTKESSNDGRAN